MAKKNPILYPLLPLFAMFQFAAAEEEPDWIEFETSIPVTQDVNEAAYMDEDPSPQPLKCPLSKPIMREDIVIHVKTLRLLSGGKVQLVYAAPKKRKHCPAVFIFDTEANILANNSWLDGYALSKKRKRNYKEAAYMRRSPFGSNMLSNGFAVAYVIAKDLKTLKSIRTADWIGLFNRIRDHKQVDSNSVFLFSTREWANSTLYIATKYAFSGFILEEPNYMLFTRKTYESVVRNSERLSSEEIWEKTDPVHKQKYYDIFSQITTPIMLVRNKNSSAHAFTEKTLVPELIKANVYLETFEMDGPARRLTVFGGRKGVLDLEPEIAYYPRNVIKWSEHVISYMKLNSTTEAIALSEPANE